MGDHDDRLGEVTIVVFDGEYDYGNKVQLRAFLEDIVSRQRLVLDLRRATFMDSICITELLRLNESRKELGLPQVTLVLEGGPLQRTFEMMDLQRVFGMVPALSEAVDPAWTTIELKADFDPLRG